MPVAEALTGGLNAGTNFAMHQQSRRRDAFDMQQKQVENYNSIVGQLSDTLAKTKEQFEAKLATTTDLAGKQKISGDYKQFFDSTVSMVGRAGQKAASSGIPVDPTIQAARLMQHENLRDLAAEQALAGTQEATAAGQKATAQVPAAVSQAQQKSAIEPSSDSEFFTAKNGDMIEIRKDGSTVNRGLLSKMASTENVNTMTQGGAASQPPGQEPFEGIGTSIMEDIRQSSGAFAAASKAVSRTVGQAVEGSNPRLDAEQRVRNFNQDFKNTLTRNPKYPVAELKAISANLLPDPSAIITDPEAEARKIPLLKQHLENLNEVDARTLQGNLSKKGRNDTIDRMASRQSGIDLIGDVPDISANTEAELDSLQEKVLSDTATEEEMKRFIELSK